MNFEELNLPIPTILRTYPHETQANVFQYLSQLDKYQRMAYCIAYEQLQTSFSITKSNGFIQWMAEKKQVADIPK